MEFSYLELLPNVRDLVAAFLFQTIGIQTTSKLYLKRFQTAASVIAVALILLIIGSFASPLILYLKYINVYTSKFQGTLWFTLGEIVFVVLFISLLSWLYRLSFKDNIGNRLTYTIALKFIGLTFTFHILASIIIATAFILIK